MIQTIIFDLDGTLLPMPSQELFLEEYFRALSAKIIPYGLEANRLTKAVWTGTRAMIENDGTMTNEDRFWQVFCRLLGEDRKRLEPVFENFYRNEFVAAKHTVSKHPLAAECIQIVKEKGYRIVLATNPVFPRIATLTRMEWAGLNASDFEWITTYENSSFCKPNLNYYKEILHKTGALAQECLMVGNDVKEDMCTSELGMETFLLTDCLICTEEEDLSRFRQGDFYELYRMMKELPEKTRDDKNQ